MTEIKLIEGSIYTYCYGIHKNTPYKYIHEENHGVALVEDKYGSRWHFSKNALVPATKEQIEDFNTK